MANNNVYSVVDKLAVRTETVPATLVDIGNKTNPFVTIDVAGENKQAVLTYNHSDKLADWQDTGTYLTNDVISYNGNIYRSLTDSNTGNTPDSSPLNWESVVGASDHLLSTNLDGGDYKTGNHTGMVQSISAATDPTANNDADDTAVFGTKILVGASWINTLTSDIFKCTNNTSGAAVWNKISKVNLSPTLQYYVDGTAGDDANDGTTWGTAKQTLNFINDFDTQIDDNITVNIRNDVPSNSTDFHTKINSFIGKGSIKILGEITDYLTAIAVTGFDNTPANKTYHSYVEASGETFIVDDLAGRYIAITAGTGAGTTLYPILSNTATRIETDSIAVDGTSIIKIVTLPKLKGVQKSDLVTLVSYSENAFQITENGIDITVQNVDTTDTQTGQVWEVSDNRNTIVFTAVNTKQQFNNIRNNNVSAVRSNMDFVSYSYLSSTGINMLITSSNIIHSSDSTGYGIYCEQMGYGVSAENRFEDLLVAISGAGIGFLSILNNNYFKGCGEAIQPNMSTTSICPWTSGAYLRIDICGIGINTTGGRLFIGNSLTVVSDAVTTEVKKSDVAGDTATFADIMAQNNISNSSTGLATMYMDPATFVPIQNPEYDNTGTNILSNNFQGAIDEIDSSTSPELSSGIISWTGFGGADDNLLRINPIDDTKFDISAGTARKVTKSGLTEGGVVHEIVEWDQIDSIDATLLASSAGTFVGLNLDTLLPVQQVDDFVIQQLDDVVRIGRLGHFNRTAITGIFNFPLVAEVDHNLASFVMSIGTILKSGGTISANGANLSLDRSATYCARVGAGHTREAINQPTTPGDTAISMLPVYSDVTPDSIIQPATTSIDTVYYDDLSGTLAELGSSKYGNVYLLFFPHRQLNTTFMIRGNDEYVSLDLARSPQGLANYRINSDLRGGVVLCCISFLKNTANLTAAIAGGTAAITPFLPFGVSYGSSIGGGATTIQGAYNNSGVPQLLISALLGSLDTQNGSGNPDNTQKLMRFLNSSADETASIRSDGALVSKRAINTGITAYATGGQTNATLLVEDNFNNVTTVATAGDSVKLPVAVTGMKIMVKNNGASAMDLFPNTGGVIDGGVADAAICVAVDEHLELTAISTTAWESSHVASAGGGNASIKDYYYAFAAGVDNLDFFNDGNVRFGWDAPGNDLEFYMDTEPAGGTDMRSLAILNMATNVNTYITTASALYDLYPAGVTSGSRLDVVVAAESDSTYPEYRLVLYYATTNITVHLQVITPN